MKLTRIKKMLYLMYYTRLLFLKKKRVLLMPKDAQVVQMGGQLWEN